VRKSNWELKQNTNCLCLVWPETLTGSFWLCGLLRANWKSLILLNINSISFCLLFGL